MAGASALRGLACPLVALILQSLSASVAGRRARSSAKATVLEAASALSSSSAAASSEQRQQQSWQGFSAVPHLQLALSGVGGAGPRDAATTHAGAVAPPPGAAAYGRLSARRVAAAPREQRDVAPRALKSTRLQMSSNVEAHDANPRPEGELKSTFASDGDNDNYEVQIPPEWERRFNFDSVAKVAQDWFREGDDDEIWTAKIFKAQLSQVPHNWVEFRVMPTESPQTARAIHIGRRITMLDRSTLAPQPHVLPMFDHEVFVRSTFTMHPAADYSLEEMLKARLSVHKWQKQTKPKTVPVNESLPLLIDILHGIRSLELAGVMNFDLTADNILLINQRAYIATLGRSCLVHDGDYDDHMGFGCGYFWDRDDFLLGSALNHAPEMIGGRLTGTSNSVWAAGLIFGELVLGSMPTHWFFEKGPGQKLCEQAQTTRNQVPKQVMQKLDQTPPGREKMREAIYNDFRVEKMEGFEDVPDYVQEILSGLLNKRVQHRWTAEEALDRARKMAVKAGMEVPEPAPLVGRLAP